MYEYDVALCGRRLTGLPPELQAGDHTCLSPAAQAFSLKAVQVGV